MHRNQLRPLFFLGNKRSGTSHLVRLLNLHPRIFVTHEADIVWILYQFWSGKTPQAYPWDGGRGMEVTLDVCKDVFEMNAKNIVEGRGIPDVFFQVARVIMKNGSKYQKPYDKPDLAWIGDKKPVQQADPQVRQFIYSYFPEARFIHIIRHPQAVVGSMVEAGKEWARVDYWKSSPMEILRRWAIHEEWVLTAKSEGYPIYSIRFEDLCDKPAEILDSIFGFLDQNMFSEIADMAIKGTNSDPNRKYSSFVLPACPEANRVMDIYGYKRL